MISGPKERCRIPNYMIHNKTFCTNINIIDSKYTYAKYEIVGPILTSNVHYVYAYLHCRIRKLSAYIYIYMYAIWTM